MNLFVRNTRVVWFFYVWNLLRMTTTTMAVAEVPETTSVNNMQWPSPQLRHGSTTTATHVATIPSPKEEEEEEEEEPEDERDLQILSFVCGTISQLLPGDIFCDCAITVGFVFVCQFLSPFCLGGADGTGYCSKPAITGDVSLLRRTVEFQFCLVDATVAGISTTGLCIDIGGELGPVVAATEETTTTPTTSSTTAVSQDSSATTLTSCMASSLDGTTMCNSCTLCSSGDNTPGYVFDCTNLHPILIQSTCTPLNIITSLQPDQNITFWPHFDAKS
jgi:hypothetical protein